VHLKKRFCDIQPNDLRRHLHLQVVRRESIARSIATVESGAVHAIIDARPKTRSTKLFATHGRTIHCVEGRDRLFQLINGLYMLADEEAMMRANASVQRAQPTRGSTA
jgi:hypothetical protein